MQVVSTAEPTSVTYHSSVEATSPQAIMIGIVTCVIVIAFTCVVLSVRICKIYRQRKRTENALEGKCDLGLYVFS